MSLLKYFFDRKFITLFVILLITGFVGLSHSHLMVPDEARYAEIPREMLALHDFITPHLNYLKYFEKPPLMYWLQAASFSLFGINNFSVRLVNALLALLQIIMVYASTRSLWGERAARFAALMLSSSFLFFMMAHFITLDMAVSTWMTGVLLCFLHGSAEPLASQKRKKYFLGCYVFAALAMLTKGLIGILLPGMVAVLWIVFYREWQQLTRIYLITGISLLAIIVIPWHALVQHANPEFFHYYFVEQHFSRYLTMSAHRYQPFWYFIPVLALGLYPWTFFLIQALQYFRHNREEITGFYHLWWISILIFFSFSHSKLVPYLLPILPPIFIAMGVALDEAWDNRRPSIPIKWAIGLTLCTMSALMVLLQLIPSYFILSQPVAGLQALYAMSAWLLLGIFYLFYLLFTKNWQRIICSLWIIHLVLAIAVLFALNNLRDFSVKSLAEKINQLNLYNIEVASYKTYYQDLPLYLKRKVTIVDWDNELNFGAAHQTQNWLIDIPAFMTRWRQTTPMLAIAGNADYKNLQTQITTYPLATANGQTLFSNQELKH